MGMTNKPTTFEEYCSHIGVIPKDQYEARLKADLVTMLDKIRAEIVCNIIEDDTSGNIPARLRAEWVAANKAHMIDIAILDKYKSEIEPQESERVMTREEAIKILKEIEYPVNRDNKEYRDMAFDMAIKALEQESILDKIRAEIEELTKCPYGTECLGANCPSNTDCMICGDHVLQIIDEYKAESKDKE